MEKKIAQENLYFLVTFFMDNVLIMQELYKRVCNSSSQYFQIRFRLSAKHKLFLGLHLCCSMYFWNMCSGSAFLYMYHYYTITLWCVIVTS